MHPQIRLLLTTLTLVQVTINALLDHCSASSLVPCFHSFPNCSQSDLFKTKIRFCCFSAQTLKCFPLCSDTLLGLWSHPLPPVTLLTPLCHPGLPAVSQKPNAHSNLGPLHFRWLCWECSSPKSLHCWLPLGLCFMSPPQKGLPWSILWQPLPPQNSKLSPCFVSLQVYISA